ncbi:helix-turn-helix domain-containing protein [Pseudomaricurvus alkylphenolicus]|uniref:AraC family transcriptional regulator n=1 Tax=Pseudomaricurvus alkylphenolicus TaxID=1306991 RepID=UPI0014230B20|nr:AraC family transcriptional regulator [Pseudomaricurvus alkylphenolicus]NIB38971.1 helix-turn-helix domain-containing protein [Pseudomaricurvus alkylphenolicus]
MRKNRLSFYLARMQQRGFSPAQVMADTGLDAETIESGRFCPKPEHYRVIIRNMLSLTGNPALGLELGREYHLGDLGVLGYAALSSDTLAQARRVLMKYAHLNEYLLSPANFFEGGQWVNTLHENFRLGPLLPFAVEEFVMRMVTLASRLTGSQFRLLSLQVSYPRPSYHQQYHEVFQCPVLYEQPNIRIQLDTEHLESELLLSDPEVFRLSIERCRKKLKLSHVNTQTVAQVEAILEQCSGEFPEVSDVVAELGISAGKLRKALTEQQLSYKTLIERTRRRRAMDYIRQSHLTPKEISYRLGYQHVSNFRRALKSWTGKTFSELRQEAERSL